MAGDTRSASEALNRLFSNLPISNHINMMLEFTDLSTLDKRMGKNKYISTEYRESERDGVVQDL